MSQDAIVQPIRSRKYEHKIVCAPTVTRVVYDEVSGETLSQILDKSVTYSEAEETTVPSIEPEDVKYDIQLYNGNELQEFFIEHITSSLVALHVNIKFFERQIDDPASTIFGITGISLKNPFTFKAYLYDNNSIVEPVLVDLFSLTSDNNDDENELDGDANNEKLMECCLTKKPLDLSSYTGIILSCIIKK